jgi:undecaprenyl phosphate-alpha-L-ara4N flippase subunit ArnE
MTLVLASWFLASVVCDVAGQLCFKRGSPSNARAPRSTSRRPDLANGWVLLGVAIYAIEIFVWIRILSLVPLAIAFPIASLNFIAITLASWLWLGERVSPRRWAGTALVTAGVVLVAQGA